MYEVVISEVINKEVRKWLWVPCCLSAVPLYEEGILPMTTLVEEFKCAKASLEMILSQSKDPVVKNTVRTVKSGKKWNLGEAVGPAVWGLLI